MDDMAEIIKRRSVPAVLFFNLEIELTFCNKEASEIIHSLPDLYETIRNVALEVKNAAHGSPSRAPAAQQTAIYRGRHSALFAIRAFLVGAATDQEPGHIMALVENIIEKHSVDMEKARTRFRLTKRELEVLHLISDGLSNSQIAKKLFISEQTAKDHARNIMRKVGVNSRAALISALQI
ncbi:MAG: DNA-binding response regulator [Candidatus Abyssobacteria bacterium SURF_5]|uniref:DNA-binding response regulator n=1 Tax=Abyssobacteria bacterium (strain SURF_5) TaxID=2093360 RepID=A0A3A4N983_ABYX5|nr:MAG: DNA-binding response regulator [Candidatus Abyssubacteria bacterium SURF_5]